MPVFAVDAMDQLSQLIWAVEEGEDVVIARSGKPVVRMTRADHVEAGLGAPITEDEFLQCLRLMVEERSGEGKWAKQTG